MPTWYEALQEKGLDALKWPYPVRYDEESEVACDVLVLGGGPAGCMAAIAAAKKGLRVVLTDKSNPKRGGGGSGVDHWLNTPNPCSKLSAEECVEWEVKSYGGYSNALSRYIASREGYDTLLELEEMGAKIRDSEDEFKGAPFRDEKTRFLFAYDYENRFIFRVWGTTFKPAMYKECKKLGVEIFPRVMITGLLTEKGEQGATVLGAMGFNNRTGEFHVFRAKVTISCLGLYEGNWQFSSELTGLPYFHPGVLSDGPAVAWTAGAELTLMEKSMPNPPPGYHLPSYGTGNPKNTWFPCTMVDARGKEIPWVDGLGNPISNLEDRTRPAPGQKFLGERSPASAYKAPHLIDDLEERVRKGEFELPLYADLPSMPEHERKVIWNLMVREEGRTRISIFKEYTEAGFDPEKDLLQSYFLLGGEPFPGMWQHSTLAFIRGRGPFASPGGLVTDWNLKTNLEGFYAAGNALFACNYYHHAAATGRYAGRKAVEAALATGGRPIDRNQVDDHKAWVYGPLKRNYGMDWKELRAGLSRVMQNYCGEPKNQELLKIGLTWLEDIEKNVCSEAYASNPHALMRVIETFNQLSCDRLILHASLARKASSKHLGFIRQDYPEMDPPAWRKFITLRQDRGEVRAKELPIGFWGDLEKNYESHNKDYKGYLSK
jgi:succinate dehydrogenase/fumarate reductase flavoprotein subunit